MTQVVQKFTDAQLQDALKRTGGNQSAAARLLGVTRSAVHVRLVRKPDAVDRVAAPRVSVSPEEFREHVKGTVMLYRQRLTCQEIAYIQDLSVSAVKRRIQREVSLGRCYHFTDPSLEARRWFCETDEEHRERSVREFRANAEARKAAKWFAGGVK